MHVGFRAEGVCDEVDSFWEDRNQGSENSGVFQSQEFGLKYANYWNDLNISLKK